MREVNPFRWKREHQIAFLFSALAGGCIGLYAGARNLDASAKFYWTLMGLWCASGMILGAMGGFIAQWSRNRRSD